MPPRAKPRRGTAKTKPPSKPLKQSRKSSTQKGKGRARKGGKAQADLPPPEKPASKGAPPLIDDNQPSSVNAPLQRRSNRYNLRSREKLTEGVYPSQTQAKPEQVKGSSVPKAKVSSKKTYQAKNLDSEIFENDNFVDQQFEQVSPPNQETPTESSNFDFTTAASSRSAGSQSATLLASAQYLQSLGYDPSIMEDTAAPPGTRMSSVTLDSRGNIQKKPKGPSPIRPAEDLFEHGLRDRNALLEQTEPESTDDTWHQIISEDKFRETSKDEEALWDTLLAKSIMTNEAYYQHAVMFRAMDLFAHFKKESIFDHTCELPWDVAPPPSRPRARQLARPQPDLVVGFKPSCFLELDSFQKKALAGWEGFMFPEAYKGEDVGRAFPFLIMEAKGPAAESGSRVLKRQTINSASYALHCMWRYYEGEKNDTDYFQNVRVFTAGGQGGLFFLTLHWACKMPVGKTRVREGYPLGFCHKVIFEAARHGKYTKSAVEGILQNVLGYAETRLRPTLQKAVDNKLFRVEAGEEGPQSLAGDPDYLAMIQPDTGQKRGRVPTAENARASRSKARKSARGALQNSFTSNGSINRGFNDLGVGESPDRDDLE